MLEDVGGATKHQISMQMRGKTVCVNNGILHDSYLQNITQEKIYAYTYIYQCLK